MEKKERRSMFNTCEGTTEQRRESESEEKETFAITYVHGENQLVNRRLGRSQPYLDPEDEKCWKLLTH